MLDLYPAYKPFRNCMRRFAITPSLTQLWGYIVFLTDDRPLGPALAVGKPPHLDLRQYVYPWDLEILVREVVLNADSRGSRDLSGWNELADAVNHIRRLEGVPYEQGEVRADIMVDLQRMPHRQFRWQTVQADRAAQIVRAWKVFGSRELDAKVHEQFGMGMVQLLRLGMAVLGGLLNRPMLDLGTDYSGLGVPRAAARAFLERLTCDLPILRDRTRACQQYNDAWLYAAFPLEHTPLIRLDPATPDRVLCPIPYYFFNRVTSGVFYDIVNSAGFDNAFGDAFQRYIGEVIRAAVPEPPFRVTEELPYSEIKANLKHGTDWIVSDGTGHLFLECKGKRLTLGAKNITDADAVARDLATMAKAIVQTYENMLDALRGVTAWQPDGLPAYPVIVTLENWHLFSMHFTDRIKAEVATRLADKGMDAGLMDEMPYTVMSASELEAVLQVVAALGIGPVFSRKTHPDHWAWAWTGFLPTHFADECRNVRHLLFNEEWERLRSEILLGAPTTAA